MSSFLKRPGEIYYNQAVGYGGALVGVDFEQLVTNRFGVQAGVGWLAFGAGLNYHLKPGIRSSFISLQYWNQSMGKRFVQSAIGPNFVYRKKSGLLVK